MTDIFGFFTLLGLYMWNNYELLTRLSIVMNYRTEDSKIVKLHDNMHNKVELDVFLHYRLLSMTNQSKFCVQRVLIDENDKLNFFAISLVSVDLSEKKVGEFVENRVEYEIYEDARAFELFQQLIFMLEYFLLFC